MQKAPNPKHPGNPGHNEKQNLRIIGIEEREDSQLKGPVNIFNKIIEENFPNLKTRNAHEHARRLQNCKQTRPEKTFLLSYNSQNTKCAKQRKILKAVREKDQVTYKGRPIRITPDFSPETMKARRSWTDVMQTPKRTQMPAQVTIPQQMVQQN